MSEVSSGIPCLESLESVQIKGHQIHLRRVTPSTTDSSFSPQSITLLLLHDLRNILSDPSVSEQSALSRLNRLQRRFFSFDELGLNPGSCVAPLSRKSDHHLSDAVLKQIKTSSKANGLWFVTVDAAMKIVFKFCTPQDAIRISLDLSPFLVATYASFDDPLDVLESVNSDDLPKEFQKALEQRMREKKSKHRFSGAEAVDWLVKNGHAASRARASEIASRLMSSGLFRHVSQVHGSNPFINTKEAPILIFQDKSSEYFTFDMEGADSISSASRSSSGLMSSSRSAAASPGPNSLNNASTPTTAPHHHHSAFHLNLKGTSKSSVSSNSRSSQAGSSSDRTNSPSTSSSQGTAQLGAPAKHLAQPYSVFVLGADRSGKTAVWSALSGKRPGTASYKAPQDRPWNHVQMERMTVSLDHDEFPNQLVSLTLWDFDTHQNATHDPVPGLASLSYFVHRAYINRTARCSALVVFDVNSLDLVDLDYWVASLTTHAPAAPIIIVGTHSDTISAKNKSKIKLFVTKRYAKVKNVRGYISISTKSTSDIEKLRDLLLQHSLHALTAQIKRERPQISLEPSLEGAIEAVSQNLNSARLAGTTFISLAEIRTQLIDFKVPEDQVETALQYLAADGVFHRISETLDQYTCIYGKPESDIKLWAILDLDYTFKLLYALNAAPPMLKMRGLISLASILESWKTVGVPHEFVLDFMSYTYHVLRSAYCMVSLLISTVRQEKAIEAVAKEEHTHEAIHRLKTTTTRLTEKSTKVPVLGAVSAKQAQEKVLARVPNPDAHCFSVPFAIPKSFDNKALTWSSKPEQNELVRVYSFERLPGQMLERACIQLVLAVLTQLRTPFLKGDKPEKASTENAEAAPGSKKRPKRMRSSAAGIGGHSTDHPPIDALVGHRSASDSKITAKKSKNMDDSSISSSGSSTHRKSKSKSRESIDKPERTSSSGKIPKSHRNKSRESVDLSNSSHSPESTPTPSPRGERLSIDSNASSSSTSSSSSWTSSASTSTSSEASSQSESRKSPSPPKKKRKDGENGDSKAALKALQDIACEQIEWTHQGISFKVAGENGFSARLYSIEGPQRETALVIRVNSETASGSSRGLRLILDNINAFVLWEYKNALSDIFIPCSCVDCIKARNNPKFVPLPVFKNAATFTFEECERAIGHGFSTLPCSVYGNEVALDGLVPDLVMSDLEAFHADYEDIIKEVELARSSNGIVYKGKYNGETVAIKEITVRLSDGTVDSAASEYFADFRHEVWVSSLLKHENIVGLKAFAIKSELDENGERIAQLAIVMEFIPNGDLYDWLHTSKEAIPWDVRLKVAEEIASGMQFLHTLSPPILHHDLKSANIFILDKSPEAGVTCRVGDFGEARTIFSYTSRERVDNPIWLAPEVMQKQKYETFADVYAFGVILWELCAREHPFDEYPEARTDFTSVLEDAIIGGLRPSIDNKIQPELPLSATSNSCVPLYAQLIKECWQSDRFKRPTFARIISTLQDIRAAMALNEAKVLHDEIQDPTEAIKRPEDLTKVEQEWVALVESVEKGASEGISIASLALSHPLITRDAGLDDLNREESPRASLSSSNQVDSNEGMKAEESLVASAKIPSVPSSPAKETAMSSSGQAPVFTLSTSTTATTTTTTITTTTTATSTNSTTTTSTTAAPNTIESAVFEHACLYIPESYSKPAFELPIQVTPAPAHTEQHGEASLAAKQALVKSTMQSIVEANRRASASASLPAHSPRSVEALMATRITPPPASSKLSVPMSGIGLRKRLAASAMIPVDSIPDEDDEHHHDHDDSDSDSE